VDRVFGFQEFVGLARYERCAGVTKLDGRCGGDARCYTQFTTCAPTAAPRCQQMLWLGNRQYFKVRKTILSTDLSSLPRRRLKDGMTRHRWSVSSMVVHFHGPAIGLNVTPAGSG